MTITVRREERRLKKAFMCALLIAGAAPVAIPLACGAAGSDTTGTGGGASSSATGSSSAGKGGAGGGAKLDAGSDVDPKCAPRLFIPDSGDTCGNFLHFPCGLPSNVVPSANCYLLLSDCQALCPPLFFNCHATDEYCVDGGIVADDAGNTDLDCVVCPGGVGRVPAGLKGERRPRALTALGDYFAAAAHLEAASVHAFRRLRRELAAHRAPARLLRAAERAARDEVRHARLTSRIARRFGGAPARARVAKLATRPLAEVAIENAVEGCIRETFGALVASYQAANAEDAEIARLMGSIARDETRHAALSWAVARWAWPRLEPEARGQLLARCREAIAKLEGAADAGAAQDLVRRAGLPGAAQHRALARVLEEQLWQDLRS